MLSWLSKKVLIICIYGLRPLLGPAQCRFTPSCTVFAVQQLQTLPLHKAIPIICTQLLACNPLQQLSRKLAQFTALARFKKNSRK